MQLAALAGRLVALGGETDKEYLAMMKSLSILTLGAFLAVGVWAIAQGPLGAAPKSTVAQAIPPASKDRVIDETQNGKTIKVKAGETVVIKLAGNPSTGYTWKLDSSATPAGLTLGKLDFTTPPQPPGQIRVGAGGTYQMRVEAKSVGSNKVELSYLRPWEKNKPAYKTFSVTIEVTP